MITRPIPLLASLISVLFLASCSNKSTVSRTNRVTTTKEDSAFVIAFGSCNHQDKAQPLWKEISARQPDVWVWLGDNIYADTKDMDEMKAMYDKQKSQPDYAELISHTSVIGVWDDHDYGVNDGDRTFGPKAQSKTAALDFLDVPSYAEVRNREGLHQSFTFNFDNKVARIILLDGRTFRDPIVRKNKVYLADPHADILGEAQWKWLESEMKKEEDILIIGCGVQIIPEEHRYEKWANFPTSRQRLFDLLDKESTKDIILLSGDRHLGEMSKLELSSKNIIEVTSSGLTHGYRGVNTESNKYRIGTNVTKLNYGVISIATDGAIELTLNGRDGVQYMSYTM